MQKNCGFISTRFAGTDGVTLEASKWAQVLREMGHACYWFAGQLDKARSRSMRVPEAFFQDQRNEWINANIYGHKHRDHAVTDAIHEVKLLLKQRIREFIQRFEIDLLISHEAGDEGFEYANWLQREAKQKGVDLRTLNTRMRDPWNDAQVDDSSRSLLDIYPCADFVTYPSLYEGFGNAFLAAVYFQKPVLINRYAIFVRDIEPKGFDLITMDGFLNERTVDQVREVIQSPQRLRQMVRRNFEVASRHYSYAVLRRSLNMLMVNFFGAEPG